MKQGKANRVLPRERTGHSKHSLPTAKDKIRHIDITRRSTPNHIFAVKDGEALQSHQKQDQELTVAQIMNSLFKPKSKKVGKTTRPFRYHLNKIPYDYTVQMTNRFKGLDLIE